MTTSRALLLSALLIGLTLPATAAAPDCERVYGIGDLHGGYDALVSILETTGLIDGESNWSGGDDCLVQTGDIVDRGERSREVLDLLIRLVGQADGRVQVLLGNHEVMNLTDDLRYVAPGEFTVFAGEETDAERAAGFESFRTRAEVAELPEDRQRAAFDDAHPPGWFAHRRAFSPGGRYHDWLVDRPIAVRVGTTLFVHGGLNPADAQTGIDALNARARKDLEKYHELRATLEGYGAIHPLDSYVDAFHAVKAWIAEDVEARKSKLEHARAFLGLLGSPLFRDDGPLWNRRFAEAGEWDYRSTVDEVLEAVGARRAAVGHTTMDDHRVHARFGDRVFLMDTGAGPAYGGRVSTIEIERNGRVRAIYPDEQAVLGRPDASWMERALAEGTILKNEPLGTGITGARKLLIEWQGGQTKAVFKTIDVKHDGLTVMGDSTREINFTDSYRWEIGAYLLDRELDLGMVPVTVERTIGQERGAVIEWIDDAMAEAERRGRGVVPPDPRIQIDQEATMHAFDALIYNVDRHTGNWLWTPDWQIYLIDHSRSFRQHRKLPKNLADTSFRLPRPVYERMKALDVGELDSTVGEAVDKGRLKILLKRRDALIKKIDAQRRQYGDEAVFIE